MMNIVVLGGGFAGVNAAKSLLKKLPQGYHVILINKSNEFVFKPLLQEVATGAFNPKIATESIGRAIHSRHFTFYKGIASKIDFKAQNVLIGRKKIHYAYLVLALGSVPNFFGIPGASRHAMPLGSMKDAFAIKEALARVAKKKSPRIFIIGAGPLGAELSTEIDGFLKHLAKDFLIVLVNRDSEILPGVPEKFRNKVKSSFLKRRVRLLQNTSVVQVGREYILTERKEKLKAGLVIWAAGVKPAPIKTRPKIASSRGYFAVDSRLNLKEFPNVFAIGDCSFVMNQDNQPVPWLAQSAEDQGKFVAKNILAMINKTTLRNYGFYSKGFILPLDKGYAVAEVKGLVLTGIAAWKLNRIAYLKAMLTFRHKIFAWKEWVLGYFRKRT